MATANWHNGISLEHISNSRRTGYYSLCQSPKCTPSAKEPPSHSCCPMSPPAQSWSCSTYTNSVQAGPHSHLSSPTPQKMGQEARRLQQNTWSSTIGNFWNSWESRVHTLDTHSEGDLAPRPMHWCWPITKSNYSANGHPTHTTPTSTTTTSNSSRSLAASKTHQNTPHNTHSTSFRGCRRSWSSPGEQRPQRRPLPPQPAPLFYSSFTVFILVWFL